VFRASIPTWTSATPAAPMASSSSREVVARISAKTRKSFPTFARVSKSDWRFLGGRRLSINETERSSKRSVRESISRTTLRGDLDRYPFHWRFKLQKAHPPACCGGVFLPHQQPRDISTGSVGRKALLPLKGISGFRSSRCNPEPAGHPDGDLAETLRRAGAPGEQAGN